MRLVLALLSLFSIVSCSSDPTKERPAWVLEPTRIVDNGYIVYVGRGVGTGLERAQFSAEGQALEDLANECSMIPIGTRIEDRYSEKENNVVTAYAKIGVEFQSCEELKKTVQPEDIRRNANVAFTQQVKRYQDLTETGEMLSSAESGQVTVPQEMMAPPPQTPGLNSNIHFYVTRQYVAYQKQIVILAPPVAFQPHSPESERFVKTLGPVTTGLQSQENEHPEFRNIPQVWSKIADRPKVERPQVLSSAIVQKVQAAPKTELEKVMRSSKGMGGKFHGSQSGQKAFGKKLKKRKKMGQPVDGPAGIEGEPKDH